MEMPKPTDAHRKLERLAGRWSGEERMSPSPWDPKGGTAIGRVNNKVALDGLAVVQEYEQVSGGATTFRGHGVFRWDANEKCYVLHWFDSMGMAPNDFRGDFKGNVLTMTDKNPRGQNRATFDFTQDGKYGFKLEMSQDGKQWMTMMEGQYSKQG